MNSLDTAAIAAARQSAQRTQDALDLLEPDTSWNSLCQRLDPASVIRGLQREVLGGAAREINAELDKRQPRTQGQLVLDSMGMPRVHGSGTGHLRQTQVAGGIDRRRAELPKNEHRHERLRGVGEIQGLNQITARRRRTHDVGALLGRSITGAAQWLPTETTQATEVEQTFGQLAFSPHTVGDYTEMSRLILLQSRPDAGDVVANDLARKIARAIEAAAFAGSGTAGQPHGIIGLTGVNAVSGATFAVSTATTAVTDTGDALTDDANPGWVCNRAVASLLRNRQEFSASGALTIFRGPLTWGTLLDFPAAGTSGVANAATAIFGNWAFATVVNWAGGLEVSLNPYANFQEGVVGLRALATIDFGVTWPSAFSAVTGIT